MAKSEREIELEKVVLVLEEEVKRLSSPPYITGTILDLGKKTAKVAIDGTDQAYEVVADAKIKEKLKRGARIVLNPKTQAIIDYSEFTTDTGELAIVDEATNGKLRVNVKGEPRIILSAIEGVKAGDEVLLDPSGKLAISKSDNKKTKYHLEEVPNAPWTNVGGLEEVIGKIQDEIEQPFLHQEVYAKYGRKPAKGILLYGPPGCGKTLIAKSIAYNLAKLTTGKEGKINGHFISIKGPEILDKWVGNSEANIRRIYQTARETAQETNSPVVVFIDEAEAVLKTRGTGISSDVGDTIVPQFLAELDGINGNGNVVTVLATNREDILDPAVVRDGRIDRKVKVPRPSKEGAREIFNLYLEGKPLQGLPILRKSVEAISKEITDQIYDSEKIAYNVISPRDGFLGSFSYRHLISGAMIKGIVDRACGYAIKREIENKRKSGLTREDLEQAAEEEFSDNLGFSQSLVKDDWQDVFGEKGRYYQDLAHQGYLVLEKANGKNTQLNTTGGKTK